MRKTDKGEHSLMFDGYRLFYKVRRSKRAKNIILKIDQLGEIEVVLPWFVSYKEADKYVLAKKTWLVKKLAKFEAEGGKRKQKQWATGDILPILGDVKSLVIKKDKDRVRLSYHERGDVIEVRVSNKNETKEVLERWYKKKALIYAKKEVDRLGHQVGVMAEKVVMSNAKTQWGSCLKRKGRLAFQWRLAWATLRVFDYVIAHEVAHLKISGHQADFWQLVDQLCEDYKVYKKWLKDYGHTLYRW